MSKTLTLKTPTLSPEKTAEIKALKSLSKKPHLDKPITTDDIKKALKWLMDSYPTLFSEKRNKPLKEGIDKDIFEKQVDNLPFSKGVIRKAIGFYVHHPLYLENIIGGTSRYNLQGESSGIVEESHKENAKEIIRKRKKIGKKQVEKNNNS